MIRRSALERTIQADIEAAIGAEPDLLLLRNSVGDAVYVNDNGEQRRVKYGLGVGSPDLVGILRVEVQEVGDPPWDETAFEHITLGIWFCLEVKTDDGGLSNDQRRCHDVWRRFGAYIAVVRSVDEAKAALDEARRMVR